MLKYRIVSCFTVQNLVLVCAIFSQLAENKGSKLQDFISHPIHDHMQVTF